LIPVRPLRRTVAKLFCRSDIFIALERIGGVMV
jgi:hypothetical protein